MNYAARMEMIHAAAAEVNDCIVATGNR